MITACIVDDEANSREVLELMLRENHPDIDVLGSFSDIGSAVNLLRQSHPDLLFLDIEMPAGNGFELVKKLEEPLPEIIFCTAYGHYALKAIECSALAYLLKPISSQKLSDAIGKVRKKKHAAERSLQLNVLQEQLYGSGESSRFLVSTVEDIKVIKFDEVVCCIAESNYTKIHLQDGRKIVASKTLKEFELILNRPNFFRIHHSYLINLNFIRRISKLDGCIVELPNNLSLDVARSRKDELLARITSI